MGEKLKRDEEDHKIPYVGLKSNSEKFENVDKPSDQVLRSQAFVLLAYRKRLRLPEGSPCVYRVTQKIT